MIAARLFGMLVDLGAQIVEIDIAGLQARDDHDLHPRELRGGRIGAVRRGGDQAYIAMRSSLARVIGADREQAGIFSLRAGIGLQRKCVIAGDGAEFFAQRRKHLLIAARLFDRREGMNVGKFRPGDRDHLRRGIELHGAGAERDHRAVERKVAIREAPHIAQQLGLRRIAVKHRMRHEIRAACKFVCDRGGLRDRRERQVTLTFAIGVTENPPELFDNGRRRGFIAADADAAALRRPMRRRLMPCSTALRRISALPIAGFDRNGVEEILRADASSRATEGRRRACAQGGGCARQLPSVHPGRDRRRTSMRSRRAAPARCRYSTSLSRAGYAARASARQGDRRAVRGCRPTRRQCVRAACACNRLWSRYRRRAGRHNRPERQNAASIRSQYRRRVRRAI